MYAKILDRPETKKRGIHCMKQFFSWIFQSVKMKAFCGVTHPLAALCWKTDGDKTGFTGHLRGCLSLWLCKVLACWLCCELLRRPIDLEAWSLSCLLPFLPWSFSAVWVSRDYEKLAPGKQRYGVINSPSQRITAFGSFLAKWSRINLL